MANLIVHGGTPLSGRIVPSANKNAVLPILCATLLSRDCIRLHRVPDITDVRKVLANNPFLRFDRTQRTGLQIDRVLRRLAVPLNEFLELNAIETLVELVRQEHYGLVGLAERLESIRGKLQVISAVGHGTLIRAIVPRRQNH